ncbi:Flagellar biosynthetic protein FlhB [Magnetospirillum sp. LM-5]|uniref:flagellar biosynthesis protein FlhB n=1 Tax=Magnetospirillum sp. LM-5 TaxID=2681466 RepID=UPI001384CB18|nr:flagellar biosynthesis protein FlhB [Magnetospirillum sp. LM-5]CAA7615119.1 Flagellar biosynthetic protein FlhB [Magnetospirillum sp. LM-5]
MSEDKTEEPTGKRLSEAREEGNIAQTSEAKGVASLVAALIIIGYLAPGMASDLKASLTPFLDRPQEIALDSNAIPPLMITLGLAMGKVLLVPMAVVVVLGIAIQVAQTKGLMWVPKNMIPKFSKLSPAEGVKRLFSPNQLVEFVKQLFKLIVLGIVLGWMIWKSVGEFENLADLDLMALMEYIHDKVYWMIFVTVLMMVVLALADYLFQYWRWMMKMKMSKQEVKDEHKNQEGDPQIKARLRSLRMQRARKRMMAAVPMSDVIVTNPTHYAVALKYDPEAMNAPVLVAKGADLVAKRIRDLGTEHDVPIVENPPLARALYATVELDQEVPPEHYKAVAEVIGYVMRLKGNIAH